MHTNVKQDSHSDSELKAIFLMKNIAVVGMSKNEEKAGHFVPNYLIEQGFNVIPVNPTITTQVLERRRIPAFQIFQKT
jgi:predicted CoA-binding protein